MPSIIQTNFNSGEWSPTLNARVDLAKYHSGAALLRNFFVDYRGGASNRSGTRYILKSAGDPSQPFVRLIPFQAAFGVSYALVFSDKLIRFVFRGSMVLGAPINITNATQANPAHLAFVNPFGSGNWIFVTGVTGMTELNNRYFITFNNTAAGVDLQDIFFQNVNSTGYTPYAGGGTVQLVYSVATPYSGSDLAQLKYAQQGNQLILTHPNYPPYVLTLISANNWTLNPIAFGSATAAPFGLAISTTLAGGNVFYSFRVTAVDTNGQESAPSPVITLSSAADIQTNAGSITVTWSAPTGAVSYNVYKARERFGSAPPTGAAYGFAGNTTGTTFIDTFPGIPPDFNQSMPIVQNPFTGSGVSSISLTGTGSYLGGRPTVTIAPPAGPGTTATADITMQAIGVTLANPGFGGAFPYSPGDIILLAYGIQITVLTTVSGFIGAFAVSSFGTQTGTVAGNPLTQQATSGSGLGASFNVTYGVASIFLTFSGSGYGAAPAVIFSAGSPTASATTAVGTQAVGNPSVPAFSQQRLILAAPPAAVNTLYGSQPGAPFNFNVSDPRLPDDALQATIVSNQLNTIKSMLGMPSGLIVLTDRLVFQVNGGGPGTPYTAVDIFANPQSYIGANDVPPLVANQEILLVQSKGSVIRNLSYNFYANVWTGTDISVLSSHLFYGYQILDWCWAEEPFKTVWAVRNDGVLLSLAFLKEQELIGWAHHDSTNGLFQSVCAITEQDDGQNIDAVYAIVQRVVDGNTVQYIERFASRFVNSVANGWFVDSGLQYNGTPITVVTGLEHLKGQTVTGLADGEVVPPTVVSASGSITLATAASSITLGLGYVAQLQTLAIDLGQPTVQGKRKSISGVTARVAATLGLSIGSDFNNLVPMKDLVIGNINEPGNFMISDLVTGDARTVIDPGWSEQGSFCIQQSYPYPVTILGVIPEVQVGDDD